MSNQHLLHAERILSNNSSLSSGDIQLLQAIGLLAQAQALETLAEVIAQTGGKA